MSNTHPEPGADLLDMDAVDAGWEPVEDSSSGVQVSPARDAPQSSESNVIRYVDFTRSRILAERRAAALNPSAVARPRAGLTQTQLSMLAVPLLILIGGALAARRNGQAVDRAEFPPEPPVVEALQPAPEPPTPLLASEPASRLQHIRVAVEPSAAEIFEGDALLGSGDIDVALEPNTQRTLRASLPGYRDRVVSVNESTPALLIRLEKAPATPKRRAASARRAAASNAESEAEIAYPEP